MGALGLWKTEDGNLVVSVTSYDLGRKPSTDFDIVKFDDFPIEPGQRFIELIPVLGPSKDLRLRIELDYFRCVLEKQTGEVWSLLRNLL